MSDEFVKVMKRKWRRSKLYRRLLSLFWWSKGSRALRYELASLRFPELPKRPRCERCGHRLFPWAYLDDGWICAWGCMNWPTCSNDEVWEPLIPWLFGDRSVWGRAWEWLGFEVN